MNLEGLREALAVHDDHEPIDPDTLEVLVSAAREHLEWLDTGQEQITRKSKRGSPNRPLFVRPGRYLIVPLGPETK